MQPTIVPISTEAEMTEATDVQCPEMFELEEDGAGKACCIRKKDHAPPCRIYDLGKLKVG